MIKGTKTMNANAINPSGFIYKAFDSSPLIRNNTDLVVPHAGQLIPYTCLEKQTP